MPKLISDILDQAERHQVRDPVDEKVAAWAAWFDCLREHVAAAKGRHPLRCADLFDPEH